jgi:hypothetical protein
VHPTQDGTPASRRFATFADEARPTSPLYAHLGAALAADGRAASIIDEAPLAQRRATLVFAAVHDLLLRGVERGALTAYYPSVGGDRAPDAAATTAFLQVLDRHRAVIVDRLRTRSTQTNEPGRTAGQRAALAWLTTRTAPPGSGPDRRRLALVEVGTSAGLLLHLDRYEQRFVTAAAGATRGIAPSRPVVIETTCLAQVPDTTLLPVAARIGVDRAPLHVGAADDRAWLRACVWPEHVDRLDRLDAALALAAAHDDLTLHRGDLLELLEPVVDAIDADLQVVVLHSATLAYLAPADRARFEAILDRIGARRALWRVGLEGHFLEPFAGLVAQRLGPPDPEQPGFVLATTHWRDGQRCDEALGRMQSHGGWLRFAPPLD